MKVIFYVKDQFGFVPNGTCGGSNHFSTYEEALDVCRKVSKENYGRFEVGVRLPDVQFEHGEEVSK